MLSSLVLAVAVIAHDPGYNTSLATHLVRWLGSEGVPARVSTPAQMGQTLAKEKLAFLVGFGSPSAAEMASLRAFRARGGRLVVFHSAAPALAALMGVKPLGYAAAPYPGAWSRMDFDRGAMPGCPASVLQTSSVLLKAVPVKGRGAVISYWRDRSGRTAGDAAWIKTDAGWWMTHVLSADGDERAKAKLLGSICAAVDPRLWNAASSGRREQAESDRLIAYAKEQVPRPGEIHAVWDHSGCGLYPGSWAKTMKVLQDSRITDVFVNVAGAGFAHYASGILPRSKTFRDEGDQLAAAIAAGRSAGIRVHAWVLCFTATRGQPATIADFRRRGWLLKTREGKETEYLDPSNAAVRGYVLSVLTEIGTRYPGLAGVHLDFVRWYERAVKGPDAAGVITRFVGEARRRVKRPLWLTAAVLGRYPASIASVGQDWEGWLDARLVDYVVPMDYTSSNEKFLSFCVQHASSKARARRVIAGIGVTANESRLDARQVMAQILISRRYGLAGNALFDLDDTLEKRILPYLRMGLW